jgi:hypothetical protein
MSGILTIPVTPENREKLEDTFRRLLDFVFLHKNDNVYASIKVMHGLTAIYKPENRGLYDQEPNGTASIEFEIHINGGAMHTERHDPPEGWAPIPGLHGVRTKSESQANGMTERDLYPEEISAVRAADRPFVLLMNSYGATVASGHDSLEEAIATGWEEEAYHISAYRICDSQGKTVLDFAATRSAVAAHGRSIRRP